jgi:hypothetical protein
VKFALLAILIIPLAGCAPLLDLTCASMAVEEGSRTVCTVTLPVAAPAGGVVVALNYVDFSGPATITIPAGQTVGQFVVEAQ